MKRRQFIQKGTAVSIGFLGLQTFVSSCGLNSRVETTWKTLLHPGFGHLQRDPDGILNLPSGFSYKTISRQGKLMTDGFYVPGLADGMAAFQGPGDKVVVIRNHEVSSGHLEGGAFGRDLSLLNKIDPAKFYDFGRGKTPCLGGTTTFIYNPGSGEIEMEFLSLTGTIRNCAGGATPWNTWISCEEDVSDADDKLEKNHGYNFEVPVHFQPYITDPVPIRDMGRFNHEAVCVHPETGIVYQTEDRGDGLIYRYLPNQKGKLLAGGRLQALCIKDHNCFDTRNWEPTEVDPCEIGKKYKVKWLDLEWIDAPVDDLRFRGFEMGAARFARGEGMWYGSGEAYFACTDGGSSRYGQIFRYTPSPFEGTPEEDSNPATLELFVESNYTQLLESCDNLTVSPFGDLVICEDKPNPKISGITPEGQIYHIAENVGFRSEFAGACFSPDGKTLFVNIQGPGLTLAIQGPWGQRTGVGKSG